NRFSHILTIEDPIEYVFRHGQGAVNQREVGKDTESFARGLRSALREDPDILMVGEMRDLESIDTVLTLAETGHLVIATLHTNDTTQAVDRLVGVFPGDQQNQARLQLSASLVGVIYQRLIPRREGGLVAAYEVLKGTTAVRNLIRETNTRQLRNAITMGQSDGMQTLRCTSRSWSPPASSTGTRPSTAASTPRRSPGPWPWRRPPESEMTGRPNHNAPQHL